MIDHGFSFSLVNDESDQNQGSLVIDTRIDCDPDTGVYVTTLSYRFKVGETVTHFRFGLWRETDLIVQQLVENHYTPEILAEIVEHNDAFLQYQQSVISQHQAALKEYRESVM